MPRVQTNGSNGHENPFLHLTARQLNNQLEKLKKPGRPSREVLALREALALQEGEPAPTSRKGKSVIEVDDRTEEKVTKKTRGAAKVAKPQEVRIVIPPIETSIIKIEVRGTESLIMHRWDEKSKKQIQDKQGKVGHKPRQARNPQAEYHAARYLDDKGRDCIPALSFKNAIVAAASFVSDVTKTLLKGAIFVRGGLIPIKYPGKKPIFREDMVRIGGMSKTADVRYRPEYPNWSVVLEIEFDKSIMSPVEVANLVSRAGFHVGVGEWRPTFGRFEVVR